jgi:adenylyl-sulfate kinase
VTHHEEKGFTVWFTGLSGAGKSTIAEMLYHELRKRNLKTEILDGDLVRQNLSKGLGFSKEDRDTNIRRIGFVAELLTRNGVATICCPISPYKETRDEIRAMIGDFVEVYVHATVDEIAEHRDPKGLYKKALAGEITNFTGVDDPYEVPENPELVLDTMVEEPIESLQQVLTKLQELGYIEDSTVMIGGERRHSGMTDLRVTQSGHVAEGASDLSIDDGAWTSSSGKRRSFPSPRPAPRGGSA